MLSSQPLPEAQLQQSERPWGAESLSPLCHLHTSHRCLQHSNLGLCSTPDPL